MRKGCFFSATSIIWVTLSPQHFHWTTICPAFFQCKSITKCRKKHYLNNAHYLNNRKPTKFSLNNDLPWIFSEQKPHKIRKKAYAETQQAILIWFFAWRSQLFQKFRTLSKQLLKLLLKLLETFFNNFVRKLLLKVFEIFSKRFSISYWELDILSTYKINWKEPSAQVLYAIFSFKATLNIILVRKTSARRQFFFEIWKQNVFLLCIVASQISILMTIALSRQNEKHTKWHVVGNW